MKQRTTIIAEIGVNHNGDVEMARQLIDAAATAEVDFVKFQTFKASLLATDYCEKAEYQLRSICPEESQLEMLRKLELDNSMYHALKDHCTARGVGFLASAFDIDSVDFLLTLGQSYIKIPSGELDNLPYLRHIGRIGLPILLSTGMATLGEIEASIEALTTAGASRDEIIVLHCTSNYPASMGEVNLRAMNTVGQALAVAVGYSDHTMGIEASLAAVALGAVVIEKHFTLDRNLPGPDHKASLEPSELVALVKAIRNIDIALGDGIKRPTPSELKNRLVARKSLVATTAIAKGEVLGPHNVTAKRPGTGISPMRWDEIVGRVSTRNFNADEQLAL